jgi:hypothetical protein
MVAKEIDKWANDVFEAIGASTCKNCHEKSLRVTSYWKSFFGHVESDLECANCQGIFRWVIKLGRSFSPVLLESALNTRHDS